MVSFFSKPDDDKPSDASDAGKVGGDKGSTPNNTPARDNASTDAAQEQLFKGVKSAVAKGLGEHKAHPEKSPREIIENIAPAAATELGLDEGCSAHGGQGPAEGQDGKELDGQEAGQGLKSRGQPQGHRKGRAAANTGGDDNNSKERIQTRSGAGPTSTETVEGDETATRAAKATKDGNGLSGGRSVSLPRDLMTERYEC